MNAQRGDYRLPARKVKEVIIDPEYHPGYCRDDASVMLEIPGVQTGFATGCPDPCGGSLWLSLARIRSPTLTRWKRFV